MGSSSARSSSDSLSPVPATFSRRCAVDDVPGMSRMFGDRRSSQARATAMGVAPSRVATSRSTRRLQRAEAPQREERHEGGPVHREQVDERVVLALGDVVEVLHADDRPEGPAPASRC